MQWVVVHLCLSREFAIMETVIILHYQNDQRMMSNINRVNSTVLIQMSVVMIRSNITCFSYSTAVTETDNYRVITAPHSTSLWILLKRHTDPCNFSANVNCWANQSRSWMRGTPKFELFEWVNTHTDDYRCLYTIHTYYDCPLQMNSFFFFSIAKSIRHIKHHLFVHLWGRTMQGPMTTIIIMMTSSNGSSPWADGLTGVPMHHISDVPPPPPPPPPPMILREWYHCSGDSQESY